MKKKVMKDTISPNTKKHYPKATRPLIIGLITFLLSFPFIFPAIAGIGGIDSGGHLLCAILGIIIGVPDIIIGIIAIILGMKVRKVISDDPFLLLEDRKALVGIVLGSIGLILSLLCIALFIIAIVRRSDIIVWA